MTAALTGRPLLALPGPATARARGRVMTAALTGRPLLALLVACYVGIVLLVARFCGVGARWDREWIDLRDGACENPRWCRWEAS